MRLRGVKIASLHEGAPLNLDISTLERLHRRAPPTQPVQSTTTGRAFSAPTFQTFRMLVVGFVCRVGEHSVCGWCPDRLGLLLCITRARRALAVHEASGRRAGALSSVAARSGREGQARRRSPAETPTPKLAAIAAAADWEQIEVTRSGKRRQMHVHSFQALLYDVWGERPVRIVLARRPTRTDGYDIALISMDVDATAAEIIEDYDERWSIEVCIEDAKQITGVGEARNRVKQAVERTVPFNLLCQSLAIAWYALNGRAEQDVEHRRRHARWYRHKRNPC